jgi:hypothetical protein
MRSSYLEQNSGKFFQEKPTVQSDAFGTTGTATLAGVATGAVLGQVSIPAGAYVTKVQLMATIAVGTQELDVGDGDDTDRYMDGISTITQYNILTAPAVQTGDIGDGTAEVSGRYYADADTIDCISTVTASAAVSVGSCILSVWYYV